MRPKRFAIPSAYVAAGRNQRLACRLIGRLDRRRAGGARGGAGHERRARGTRSGTGRCGRRRAGHRLIQLVAAAGQGNRGQADAAQCESDRSHDVPLKMMPAANGAIARFVPSAERWLAADIVTLPTNALPTARKHGLTPKTKAPSAATGRTGSDGACLSGRRRLRKRYFDVVLFLATSLAALDMVVAGAVVAGAVDFAVSVAGVVAAPA